LRVLALDPDVIVFISAFWQTTCTALRADEEGFVIDSPVLPHELEAMPQVLEQSAFPVSGLLVTHGDWDHLLARHAFPDASLGCGESTAELLAQRPDVPARELAEFDEEHYIAGRPPLSVDELQQLPVPGRLELGAAGREIELHPTPGHTTDGTAYLISWLGMLVPGDYLSPVEIPWISAGGSAVAYLDTLERLRGLVERSEHVVPGHGGPLSPAEATRILDEDVAYVCALLDGESDVALPTGRNTAAQRRIHAENLGRLAGGEGREGD
jgi:glyoxylase-like metal-dependent hydrolase (beta-lactamase superfamily II)